MSTDSTVLPKKNFQAPKVNGLFTIKHALRLAAASMLVLGLAGCGSDQDAAMPDVTGKRLDVALSDVERAGFKDEPEVIGGGVFGVIDESNWQVCEQAPGAGEAMSETPRLTVERSCGGDDADDAEAPSEEASPTKESDDDESDAEQILTAKNSEDFAALLRSGKQDRKAHKAFAKKYEGRTIEFDGCVAFMMPHGDYDTRFDFLIYRGNFDDSHTTGPSFAFIDANYYDLNLEGSNAPDSVETGLNLHSVAVIEGFDGEAGAIVLDPISTRAR